MPERSRRRRPRSHLRSRLSRLGLGVAALLAATPLVVAGTTAVAAPAGAGTAKTAAGPAFAIRVDQVGYPTAAAKVGEIMASAAQANGVKWQLLAESAGHWNLAASGTATTDLGSWNSQYQWVYEVDFTSIEHTGRYKVVLAGDPAVFSPTFAIEPAKELYAQDLDNAVYFYENEMSGPEYVKTPLRAAPGDTNDGDAMTYTTPPMNGNGNFKGSLAPYATGVSIDADGGWFDAGDNLKFVVTTSYVVAILLQGIESFPQTMSVGSGSSFLGEAEYGVQFMQRMWDEKTKTLYYQVGIGEANNYYYGDHDIWRLPQADDGYMGSNPHYLYIRHPPVLRAAPPGSQISPNIAGRLVADFGLCYRVFRTRNIAFANSCLQDAETVYSLAGVHWTGRLLTAAPWDFYPETTWRDDMTLGATELSLAVADGAAHHDLPAGLPVTSPEVYLKDAGQFAHRWVTGTNATYDTLNLYDVSALADYELDLAMGYEHDSNIGVTSAELVGNLQAQIEKGIGIASSDPFRLGFAWDQWDTTTHGAGLSVMANMYDALVHKPTYAWWAQHWLDDILGANAWDVTLIVGDGTRFPHCMQHQIANIAGSLNGGPPVLAGAAVEGPNSFAATGTVPNMRACSTTGIGPGQPFTAFNGHGAVYEDNVQSYSTNEPAIDLTSLTPLAFAWQISAAGGLEVAPPA